VTVGVHHVALEIPRDRADACAAFWTLLGFEEVDAPASLAQRARWLEATGTQIHLLLTDEPSPPAREGHVAIVVGDVEGAMGRLTGAGHIAEERSPHWGAPRALTTDPVGHRVELMAWPPSGNYPSAR
jgi:catechol 2,3-dioxygenase-like lactoylglutathione lyase family enzyme